MVMADRLLQEATLTILEPVLEKLLYGGIEDRN